MSMIGEYVRLTPAELDRAVRDPDWAWEFVEEQMAADPGDGAPVAGGRLHSTGKMWHALEYLLGLRGVGVDVVHGEEEIPGAEDWGYGAPRVISPERVRVAAGAMGAITPEGLVEGVGPAGLAGAGIYPYAGSGPGEGPDEAAGAGGDPYGGLEDAAAAYQDLAAFFRVAARLRHGLLVWIA
ncbi:YfbM family protein [Streptomyces sp. CAU 1734]|uniref:YfbM family protein n=1 Tax=Streptomyces sp. CAU 1734 TaxID=3140360 RepID=UPI00325FFB69